jgi:hypothetical protein
LQPGARTQPLPAHDQNPLGTSRLSGAERRGTWLALALFFTLFRALPSLSYPIARDQAVYCVLGRGLLEGKQLYLDFWDNRSPGLAYIYAVIVKLFGSVMWCVGAVDILWLLVIAFLIFRFAERYLGPAAATVSVVVYASWHTGAGYWQAAQAEPFLMTFIFASFALVVRDDAWVKLRHIAAGALLGGAFWTKYNGVLLLPVVCLLPYLDTSGLDMRPPRIRLTVAWRAYLFRATLVATGFLTVVGLVLLYFWYVGSLAEFQYQQFEIMPRYVAMAAERTPHLWLYGLVRTELVLGFLVEVAAAAALFVAWRQGDLGRVVPILIAAALGYLSVAVQVRFHDYGFESCLPFLAMVWGYLCVKAYDRFGAMARACAERGWRLAQALVWVVLANIVAWVVSAQAIEIASKYQALAAWWRTPEAFYGSYPWARPISHFPDQMRVISYLRENLQPRDEVFVWGSEPLIYFLVERPCPTRFALNLPLISPWSPPAWREEVVNALGNAPPRFVVVARDDDIPYIAFHNLDSEEYLAVFPELAALLAGLYEPVANLEFFVIYRRKSLPGGPG